VDTNNCSITITTDDVVVTNSGISFEEATNQRWTAERHFSNKGYIWVQRGYIGSEEIRNMWVNETTWQRASITITCGRMVYPS
jgi:hypothetical protein